MMAKNLNKNAGKRQKMFSLIAIHGQFCFQKELQYEKWWLIPCTSKVFFWFTCCCSFQKKSLKWEKKKMRGGVLCLWCWTQYLCEGKACHGDDERLFALENFLQNIVLFYPFAQEGSLWFTPPVKSDDSQSPNHSLFCCLSFFSVFSNCKIHPQKKTMEKMKFSFVFFMSVWPC